MDYGYLSYSVEIVIFLSDVIATQHRKVSADLCISFSLLFSSINLGLHCRSHQLDRPDCQKFPTELDNGLLTRLLLEHYLIILYSRTSTQDSYTTSTRLTTRSLLEHTDLNRSPTRSAHEHRNNYSIQLHEQFQTN